jgi:hypothetical protein
VDNSVNSINVTPSLVDIKASVKLNNISIIEGGSSAPIDLSVGNNTIDIEVTAEDLSKKHYTLNVIRNYSSSYIKQVLDVDTNGKIEIDDIVKIINQSTIPDLNFDGKVNRDDIMFMLMQIDNH